jgi:hypothetical protein
MDYVPVKTRVFDSSLPRELRDEVSFLKTYLFSSMIVSEVYSELPFLFKSYAF